MVRMDVGLMLDYGKGVTLAEAVGQAVRFYERKMGAAATICYAATEWGLEGAMVINGVMVVAERSVPARHLFIGSGSRGGAENAEG